MEYKKVARYRMFAPYTAYLKHLDTGEELYSE